MATEPYRCKTLVLRVSIHCEGCKKKVKKALQSVDGVFRCDIDARSNKATVAVTGDVSADALVKRLRRSGKRAEQWPEQQQQQPAQSTQSPGETKTQATEPDKPGGIGTATDHAKNPASGGPETNSGEQSNPDGDTEKPAQDGTNTDGDRAVVDHGTKEPTAKQCRDPKRKRKQQEEEKLPVDSMVVTAASDHFQFQQPVHVVSYSMARPSASAAYYAAAQRQRQPRSRLRHRSSRAATTRSRRCTTADGLRRRATTTGIFSAMTTPTPAV